MAVAFDAAGPSATGFYSGSTPVSSASWQHTCTGTNLLLIVDVGISNNPDTGLGVNASYGGTSMTLLAGPLHSGSLSKGFMVRFLLINPAAGRNTVSITVTGGKAVIVGGSMSFNGADQSTGVAATTYSATGVSTTPTVTVSSNTSGNIIASANVSGHSNRPIGSGGTFTWQVNGTLAYDASNGAGGTWAATGSAVTTSFTIAASPGLAGDDWAIISNEVLSATSGVVVLPAANIQFAAPPVTPTGEAQPTQWTGATGRTPNVGSPGPPSLLPIQVSVNNTAGYWMFAVVSWRQDAGTAGVLQYPSTINVSDDAGNFWIPVQPGQHQTGIVRCAIWMAPAARTATTVTVSPASTIAGDAYQSCLVVNIFEYQADCPWYEIEESEFGYVNQGSTLTVTQANTTTGLFSVGVVAYDNYQMPVTVTAGGGWLGLYPQGGANFTDDTADLQEYPFIATTAGSPLSLTIARASGSNVADMAGVIMTVHGVTDTIAFPYTMPDAENWPVLITEMATGPVINANPLMNGTSDWSVEEAGGGSVAGTTWPVYRPFPAYQSVIGTSLAMTPSGTAASCTLVSELEPVSVALRYNTLAYVYSLAGYGAVAAQVNWYDITKTLISVSTGAAVTVQSGTWTPVSWASPTIATSGAYPPGNAAYAAAAVVMLPTTTSLVASSAVLYVGYCALGVADAYENIPLDDISWTDLSSRNFTESAIQVSRGIQYEQQSLEAGTMTVTLYNSDGEIMFGNLLSPYWPNMGDTDVPIRLRAVWPQSLTPYYTLFSGFTDQITFSWNDEDLTGYAEIEAADAWSRLTTQMLDAGLQEVLEDSPVVYCPLSNTGANISLSNVTPMVQQVSAFGAGSVTAAFTGNLISLPGLSSESCWQSAGSGSTSASANQGVALTYFPSDLQALPPVADGVTTSWWFAPNTELSTSQPATQVTLATCYSGTGPMWTIDLDNSVAFPNTFAYITVYDQTTGAATTTQIGSTTFFIGIQPTAGIFNAQVTFTQTTLTASIYFGNGADVGFGETVTVACNLAASIAGFSLGGNAGPLYANNRGGTLGFWSVAFSGFAVFAGQIPAARLAAQVQTAAVAWPGEEDTSRLARIIGYAGATPVILQSQGWGLTAPPAADADTVTAITDTNGQVTSSYFTNIASSTLAFMFVNGEGILVYRRRLQQYDRVIGQWAIGDEAAVPLNGNTLGQSYSTAGWLTLHGATLVPASVPSVSPLFLFAGLMHGDGVTATPQIKEGAIFGTSVTAGDYYSVSCAVYSPQGWANGVTIGFTYNNSGGSGISTLTSTVTALAAGSFTYLSAGPLRAPQNAAFALIEFAATGTPASTVQFYVTDVRLVQVPVTSAGGPGATAPEVPCLVAPKLSSDRALMFNQAILTQFGTNTSTQFQGSSLVFQPTSGVLVTIQNNNSVLARAGVPYTATSYMLNTAQALPYYLNEPSIEDFGNWITQTLAEPLLRPDTVTITPVATTQAMQMALQAEIADTATFHRRQPAAPEIRILTYVSKLSHAIDIEEGQWETQYELSPYQAGVILACDDVIHGTGTGGNLLGF